MDFEQKLEIIAQNLRKSEKVNLNDNGEELEAYTIAHALLDIEKSANVLSNNFIPKLLDNEITENELNEILIDIGDVFRHIIYHIKDSKYYDYLDI
jgi:hypothetical protein